MRGGDEVTMVLEEVTVRKMADEDLPQVNEISHSLFGKERVSTWPQAVEAHWKRHRPTLSFVAEADGHVVGFLLGGIRRARRMMPLAGWIDIMGIHPDYQRKGIGRRLVEAFSEECKKSSAVISVAIKKNDKPLRKFFNKMGFRDSDLITLEK